MRATDIRNEDLDEMIRLVQQPSHADMAKIKIQLFEQKQDYLEAFMLHLTNEMLKKNIFKWLLDTFEKLTRHDAELRHRHDLKAKKKKEAKQEKKDTKASKAAMSFEARKNMTDQERLKAELVESSDSDDGAVAAQNLLDEDSEEETKYDEFAPLTKLKSTVKNKVLELATNDTD